MCSIMRVNRTSLTSYEQQKSTMLFSSFKSISVNKTEALRFFFHSCLLWSWTLSISQTLSESLSTLSQGPPSKTNILVSMKEHSWHTDYVHSCTKSFRTWWLLTLPLTPSHIIFPPLNVQEVRNFSMHHFKILWSICLGPLLPNRLLLSFKCV